LGSDAIKVHAARRFQHAASGISVMLPASWEVFADPTPDVALVALEPAAEPEGFRANLVLTVGPLGGRSLGQWQSTSEAALAAALADYHLIDLERLQVGGHPGGRRVAHYLAPAGTPVTLEQWFTVVSDLGCTLTATVSTARYCVAALVFAELARTVQIGGRDG
jgi:hypothetical protein